MNYGYAMNGMKNTHLSLVAPEPVLAVLPWVSERKKKKKKRTMKLEDGCTN